MYLWERNWSILSRDRFYSWWEAQCVLTAFSWCQKGRQIRRTYFISIASSVQQRKPPRTSNQKKENWNWKIKKNLADAVVEEVDFFVWICRFQWEGMNWYDVWECMHEARDSGHEAEIADMKLSWREVRDKYSNIWSSMFFQNGWWHSILQWFSKLLFSN